MKDDGDWKKMQPRNKQQVMLIGVAESAAPAPSVDRPTDLQVQFVEDLSTADQAAMSVVLKRQGLKNIGNTCYMNAVIQALRALPEFEAAVTSYAGTDRITKDLGDVYRELSKSIKTVDPKKFWTSCCLSYPQFLETTDGHLRQHDADEFMTLLLNHIGNGGLKEIGLFEGRLSTRRHCLETDFEEDSVTSDTFRKLECHIDSTISHLLPGVEMSLKGQVEKHSSVLDRDALYSTETKIEKLPYFLTMQFVRFFWKASIGDRAKIVRPVQFPMELDVLSLCSAELSEKVKVVRAYDRAVEEKKSGLEMLDKEASEKALATPQELVKVAPLTNQTGLYELTAIVTHIGMSADGGHYIAWAKEEEGWFKYDDDKVTPASESDVGKVDGRGGAQGHIAYIAIYRTKPRE